jgi:hypothetical protein
MTITVGIMERSGAPLSGRDMIEIGDRQENDICLARSCSSGHSFGTLVDYVICVGL